MDLDEVLCVIGLVDKDMSEDYKLVSIIKKCNDINLVNKAKVILWDKYHLLRVKDKNALIGIAKENGVSMESEFFDDYEEDSYDYFQKALDSVDIDRKELVKMKDSWQFWLQYHRYLMCFNRTIITRAKNKHKYEVGEWLANSDRSQVSRFDLSPTTSYRNPYDDFDMNEQSRIQQRAITDALKQFSSVQKSIWKMREEGIKNKEISEALKITSKDVSDNLKSMKQLVDSLLAKYSGRSTTSSLPLERETIEFDTVDYMTVKGKKVPKIDKETGRYKMVHYSYVAYVDKKRKKSY